MLSRHLCQATDETRYSFAQTNFEAKRSMKPVGNLPQRFSSHLSVETRTPRARPRFETKKRLKSIGLMSQIEKRSYETISA